MFVEILLFILLLFLVILLNKRPKDYPPGKWGLPIVGMFPTLPTGRRYLEMLKDCRKQYGDVFSIRNGSMHQVYLCNFELIKEAYSKLEFSDRPSLFLFTAFTNFKNLGITFSNRDTWRVNRRFALSHLRDFGLGKRSMEDLISREVAFVLEQWDALVDKPAHIDRAVNVATLNVIWAMAAAKRFDINDKEINEFTALMSENLQRMDGPIALLDIFPWLAKVLPNFILNGYMEVDKVMNSSERLMKYFEKIVDEHIETLDQENARDFTDVYLIERRKKENGSTFSKEDLTVTLSDLFLGGSETVSTTIRWLLLYMAAHPDIQEKAYNEIYSVVGSEVSPSLIHRERLPYTEAIINEVNRLSCIDQFSEHSSAEDAEFRGYKIPKGTIVMGGLHFCHRSPQYWERPDDFYPEHFLDGNGKCIARKDGYLPFSIGRRVCIGESMARMSLFLFFSAILQRYKIRPAEGQKINLDPDPRNYFFAYPQEQPILLSRREKGN